MPDGALPEITDVTLEAPLITIFFTHTLSSILCAAAAATLVRASQSLLCKSGQEEGSVQLCMVWGRREAKVLTIVNFSLSRC